jgi:branched-chain amino acid aminotransferase
MAAFGTHFAGTMAFATFRDGEWSKIGLQPVEPLHLHPAAHVFHYASTCFEGLKAYRHADGSLHIFRLDRHIARLLKSTELLCLPVPSPEALEEAIRNLVGACADDIPPYPGALYLRPVVCGTEPNIGGAAHAVNEAVFFVLASPVGSYFGGGGEKMLRIFLDDQHMRSTPDFGAAKSGGNYAAALRHIIKARSEFEADQVLFCPGGDVQETGAANFFLLDDDKVVTRAIDGSILDGITRDSLLTLARSNGYTVEERQIPVHELLEWVKSGEAALSGTAAVLAGVGTLIYQGQEYAIGDGRPGRNTRRLREMLSAIHSGESADELGWLTPVR